KTRSTGYLSGIGTHALLLLSCHILSDSREIVFANAVILRTSTSASGGLCRKLLRRTSRRTVKFLREEPTCFCANRLCGRSRRHGPSRKAEACRKPYRRSGFGHGCQPSRV